MEKIASDEYYLIVFFFCMGMALVTLVETFQSYSLLVKTNTPQKLLGLKRMPKLSKSSFLLTSFLLCLFLLLASITGYFTPLSLLICFCLYFLVYGQLGFLGRKSNLYPFTLFFLAIHPYILGERISFTSDSWTLLFIKTTLSFVYLASFTQKIRRSGSIWMNGEKMKGVLIYHDHLNGTNFFGMLGKYPGLLQLSGLIILLFEGFFWISVFFPEYDFYFGITLVLFHLLTLIFLKINYLLYYFPILLLYFIH